MDIRIGWGLGRTGTTARLHWTSDGYAYLAAAYRAGLGWHLVGPIYKRRDPAPRHGPIRSRQLDIDAASNRKLKRELEAFLADTARVDRALVDLANAEERANAERVAQARARHAAAIRERLEALKASGFVDGTRIPSDLADVAEAVDLRLRDDDLLKLAGAFR